MFYVHELWNTVGTFGERLRLANAQNTLITICICTCIREMGNQALVVLGPEPRNLMP